MKQDTQERYLRIYNLHLEKKSALEIASKVGCTLKTVENALRFCRQTTLRPTREDELQDAIDSVKKNLAQLHERLAEIRRGVRETTTRRDSDGRVQTTRKLLKPIAAEVALFREIREHEKLLSSLQGQANEASQKTNQDKQIIIEFVH